jgi:hypothetical protein
MDRLLQQTNRRVHPAENMMIPSRKKMVMVILDLASRSNVA